MKYRILDCTGFSPKEIEDGINYYANDDWRVVCAIGNFLVLERHPSTPIPSWNLNNIQISEPVSFSPR